MLRLQISKDSERFLRKLPPKHQRQRALKILDIREKRGQGHDAKALKGYTFLRTDVGEYRIIHEVDADTLFILLIGKRNDSDVYKKLSRKK